MRTIERSCGDCVCAPVTVDERRRGSTSWAIGTGGSRAKRGVSSIAPIAAWRAKRVEASIYWKNGMVLQATGKEGRS